MAKKRNSITMDVSDITEFLKKFDKKAEDFTGKGGAIERAVLKMTPYMDYEYISVIQRFKNPTGVTEESLMTTPEIKWNKDGKLTYKYGFKISKGGVAAIFINYGRPGIKYSNGTVSKPMQPTYFIDSAANTFTREFGKAFKEEVKKELGGLL